MTTFDEAMRRMSRAQLAALVRFHRDNRNTAGRGMGELSNATMCAAIDELRERDRVAGELDEALRFGRT
jgi:hypothetical protein